jgi:amino-acid N-acetyltransferase
MNTVITRAHNSDYAEVLTLLREVNLPVEGVPEHFGNFLVARSEAGHLVGCVGQERYGSVALLRSLAVSPAQRGAGLGRELTLEVLSAARASGVTEIVLLTTTAADFFQHHFGFATAERARYDAALANSPEWKLPRCSSATCLSLALV